MVRNKKYRVGIIGCGRMGWLFNEDKKITQPTSHANAYTRNKRTEVVAVCDINLKRLKGMADKYNIQGRYQNYQDMMKKESLDIISICTPTQTHAQITKIVAKSGVKVIFCEKPIAVSLKEADEMIEVCRKNQVQLVVFHNRRWDSAYQQIGDVLKKGALGDLDTVHAYSPVGLANSGTHLFDLLRFYFGDVKAVSGEIIPDSSGDPGAQGTITFKNGMKCTLDSRWREYLLFGMDVLGDKGVMQLRNNIRSNCIANISKMIESKRESGIKELKSISIKPPKWNPPIVNAVDNIVRYLDKGEKVKCTGEDGKAALEIAVAFHETSRRKRKINLPLRNRVLKVIPRQTSFTKSGKLS